MFFSEAVLGEADFPTFVLDMLFSGLSSELFPDELVVSDNFLLMLTCAGEGGKTGEIH